MTATAKCEACGGTGIIVEAPLGVHAEPKGVGRVALTFDSCFNDVKTLTCTHGPCVECSGTGTAVDRRARLGRRELTDAERDEQLRRNLDDLCPAERTEVTS